MKKENKRYFDIYQETVEKYISALEEENKRLKEEIFKLKKRLEYIEMMTKGLISYDLVIKKR